MLAGWGNFACASHLLSISKDAGATASNAIRCGQFENAPQSRAPGRTPVGSCDFQADHGAFARAILDAQGAPCSPRSATHD